MSGGDDPFSRGGKTVIRPNPGGGAARSPGGQDAPQWKPPDSGPGYNPRVTAPAYQPGQDQYGHGGMPNAPDDWLRAADPVRPPQQPAAQVPAGPKIPLEVALNARDGMLVSAANPLTAAATPLLILLGRLRLMIIDVQARPLMEHVANEIIAFERNAIAAGAERHDVEVGKYVLCGTADDIVQNLPGTEKQVWLQYSMVAQFFQRRTSGVGFYTELNRILQNPGAQYDLLELMHACLSLGFEGQYRGSQGGATDLQRIRRDVYQTLRHLRSRSDEDISPRWRGLELRMRHLAARVPVWVIGTAAAALAVGVFFLFRVLLGNNVDALADQLVALHPASQITLERASFTPAELPDFRDETQLERIRAALAAEIAAGGLAVDSVGEVIIVRVSNVLLFESGSAQVRDDFAPLAERISAALEREPGPISVIGHTDNVKPSGTGRFKSNYDLSVARAEGVKTLMAGLITDPARLLVEGRGENEPFTGNDTPEGRSQNRRVEIMIPREETLRL